MSTDEFAPPTFGDTDLAFGQDTSAPMLPPFPPLPSRIPDELEQLFDLPVTVQAVLGHVRLPVGELLRIGPGTLLELDRRVGEAVDILVNDRLVARGEVVLVEERLGVTMTEIVLPQA